MKTALAYIGIVVVLTRGASAISVTESAGMIKVDTGQIQFALDTGRSATLRWVEKDGRRMVEDNKAPLLSARLMESAVYDGVTDFAPGRRSIDAQYTVDRVDHTADDQRFAAILKGKLQFGDGDCLPFTIRLATQSRAAHLDVDITLSAEGDFRERFVRDVVLRLPLALDWRKRVAQGGDRGLQWRPPPRPSGHRSARSRVGPRRTMDAVGKDGGRPGLAARVRRADGICRFPAKRHD